MDGGRLVSENRLKKDAIMKSLVIAVLFLICCFYLPDRARAEETPQSIQRRMISPAFSIPKNAKVKIAFFDADSTLRVSPSGKPTANSVTDVALLPMLKEPMVALASDGYLLAIVSNQLGISKGYISAADADAALQLTIRELASQGIPIHYYDFADTENGDRKPDIGMGERLASLIQKQNGATIDWEHSLMIGDSGWKKGKDTEPDGHPGEDFSNTDRLFAENLAKKFGGVKFVHPRDFFHWIKLGIRNFPDYQVLKDFRKAHPEIP